MKSRWITASSIAVAFWLATMPTGRSQSDIRRDSKQAGDVVVITSEKMTFDYGQNFALFEEDVLVVDVQMKMVCDKLVVWFDEDDKPQKIKAEGNVQMSQEGYIAESGEALYDMRKATVTLTVNPRVQQGSNYMEGDVITYHVDTELIVCEPAKLAIFPGSDGPAKSIIPR